MARQIAQIQQQMLDNIAADSTLSGQLTSTSKRAIYRLFTFIVAVAIGFLEQLIDVFTAQNEAIAAAAHSANAAWLQKQVFAFQYSADNPQVVQYTAGGAPYYAIVDPALQIISRCSIVTTSANQVQVKVATGDTPGALSTTQLSALNAYLNPPFGIGVDGITYNCISGNSDKLFVQALIYFQGQYSSVIKANVIAAINAYLANLSSQANFNGQVKVVDLIAAIRNVPGVNNVILQNVIARADSTLLAAGTYMVQNETTVGSLWNTVAGYIVSETTSGSTLADSLTFLPE